MFHGGLRFAWGAVLASIIVIAAGVRPAAGDYPEAPLDDHAVFASTAAQVLSRNFASPTISYLLLDLRSQQVITAQWERSDAPIPVGSLVKPFVAIAYAESHRFVFPQHVCRAGTCWQPRGHGNLDLAGAIAVSCNSYFIDLAGAVTASEVRNVARRFGLNGPVTGSSAEDLTGKHGTWRESPRAVAQAYTELLGRRSQPGIREIVSGMAASSSEGTAAAVSGIVPHLHTLAKTGTAPCTHAQHAPGDGLAVVAWPADAPRYLLLVREHGKPGAQAAALAAHMLRALEPQS